MKDQPDENTVNLEVSLSVPLCGMHGFSKLVDLKSEILHLGHGFMCPLNSLVGADCALIHNGITSPTTGMPSQVSEADEGFPSLEAVCSCPEGCSPRNRN